MNWTRRRALLGLGAAPLSALIGCEDPPTDVTSPILSASPAPRPTASISPERARWNRLLATREKLRPLHERPGPAKPGEWRYEYTERGQTFEEYVRGKPTLPTAQRRTLVIQPIGPFDPVREKILDLTIDYMGRYFNLPTRREPALPLEVIPAKARRVHPRWGDKQLHSDWILHQLLEPKLPADAAAMIAFTASDLYPDARWNYVFGEADLKARVGVWSVYRHGDPSHDKNAFLLALRRALKVAVHETGHMFSLEHCIAYRCVQAGVNNLDEEDRAPLWLCAECVTKIVWATENEYELRYEKLLAFCRDAGLEDEARFFERSLDALRG
jgi:archaemetzincin